MLDGGIILTIQSPPHSYTHSQHFFLNKEKTDSVATSLEYIIYTLESMDFLDQHRSFINLNKILPEIIFLCFFLISDIQDMLMS